MDNCPMQSIILISDRDPDIHIYTDTLATNLTVSPYNRIDIEPDHSIGVDQIRSLREMLKMKPAGGGNRLTVFHKFHTSTPEAQNMLLKILEEPAEHNNFLLIVESLDQILPTIISRCQITYAQRSPKPTKSPCDPFEAMRLSPGERILLTQKLATTKEKALEYFDQMLLGLESRIRDNQTAPFTRLDLSRIMGKLLKAKTMIEKNINYKTVLDLFILGLPKIPKNDKQ